MQEPLIIDAHGRHAQAVLFCTRHNLLLSAGMDANVHLWSLPGFDRRSSIAGHGNSVNTLSLNPLEDLLATGSSDQTARVWSFPDGKLLHTFDKQVNAVFSPAGDVLATIGNKGRITLWETERFSALSTLPAMDKRSFTLAFSPDGHWLMVGGGGDIRCYNLLDQVFEASLEGHEHAVPSLQFTREGDRMISSGAEAGLIVWNPIGWDQLLRIPLPAKGVMQTALSADGSTVFVSMDYLIAGYDLASGDQVREIPLTIKGVYGLAISTSGALLANAGADGNIRVWEL